MQRSLDAVALRIIEAEKSVVSSDHERSEHRHLGSSHRPKLVSSVLRKGAFEFVIKALGTIDRKKATNRPPVIQSFDTGAEEPLCLLSGPGVWIVIPRANRDEINSAVMRSPSHRSEGVL